MSNRCLFSLYLDKYMTVDWQCDEQMEKEVSWCGMCRIKSDERHKAYSAAAKAEQDAMEEMPCDPNPIVGKTKDNISGKTVFYPSSSEHFGSVKGDMKTDWNRDIKEMTNMSDEECDRMVKYFNVQEMASHYLSESRNKGDC